VGAIGEAGSRSSEIRKNIELSVKQQHTTTTHNVDRKALESVQNFLIVAQIPPVTIERVIHEAALAIYRTFSFKEVAIGLKSETDGRYRYEEFLGLSKPAEQALRKLSYSLEEFYSLSDYPSIWLSEFTELCIVEENPLLDFEKDTYDKETFLSRPRKSPDEFLEGDYLDISMYNEQDELIGWIELSKPIFSKMPSIQTINRIEVFASVLSILIQKTLLTRK